MLVVPEAADEDGDDDDGKSDGDRRSGVGEFVLSSFFRSLPLPSRLHNHY